MSADSTAASQQAAAKKKLVVVVDLGRLRAYRLEDNPQFSHPRLKLIEVQQTNVARHLSEDVDVGRYRNEPAAAGALSDGEEHNLELQRRHQAVKTLARGISELIQRERLDECYLAADARINQPLLDEMDPAARAKIQKNISANLSKHSPEEIRERFCGKGNQRESPNTANRRGKSFMDLPDTPRRRETAQGVRRTQLGRTLPQGELASRDPVRE